MGDCTVVAYLLSPSQNNQSPDYCLYDFFAFRDKSSIAPRSPRILIELVGKGIWNDEEERPCVSDHLPVEGFLAL